MAANKDELVPPEWLTPTFVESVLRKYKNDENLLVHHIEIQPGSNVGDHFASVMFRIKVSVSDAKSEDQHEIALILKTTPFVDGVKMEFLHDNPIFNIEIKMYAKALPAIEHLLKKCDIPMFWPKLVYQALEPTPILIFEDLSKEGFVVPKKSFSFEDGKLLYSHLAALHAASYYLSHMGTFDFGDFSKGILNMPRVSTESVYGTHLDIFIDEIAKWPGFEMYYEKLKLFRTRFIDVGQQKSKSVPGGYNVLNHGDFHYKNILLKLAGDEIRDCKILDYQISFFTSPALDLVYSLYLLMSPEARKRRDELVKHYHNEFVVILKKLKFNKPIPTLDDLNKEIERFGYLEVILVLCFLPYNYADFSKIDDTVFLGTSENAMVSKRLLFRNEEFHKVVKQKLPQFLELGFLDL